MISDFGLFWANVNWYNRSKYKDWMGPSVKFVSRINGSFSKKNYGSIFFSSREVWWITRLFTRFFIETFPYIYIYNYIIQSGYLDRWCLLKVNTEEKCSDNLSRLKSLLRWLKNTKNWYTIDALDAIFTILDTFAILLQ